MPKKPFPSKRVFNKLMNAAKPDADGIYVHNRNPRNLEMMKIGYKPSGYWLDRPGKSYWHKLQLNKENNNNVTASIVHYRNGVVLQASTNEWSLRKQLYKSYDTSAYTNLAKVLAQRCIQAGIIEMCSDIEAPAGGKIEQFLREFENGGVLLTEAERYVNHRPYKPSEEHRMVKQWEIHVD